MVKKKVSIRDKVAQIYQTLSDVQPDVKVNDTIVTYLDKIQQSLDKLVNTGSSGDNLMQFSTDVDTVESDLTDSDRKVPSSALVKNLIDNIPTVTTAQSSVQGQVYDVTYINSVIGDIETLLQGV